MIEPMENIPVAYSRVKIIDATGNFAGTTMRVAKAVDIKHSLNSKNIDVFGVLEVKVLYCRLNITYNKTYKILQILTSSNVKWVKPKVLSRTNAIFCIFYCIQIVIVYLLCENINCPNHFTHFQAPVNADSVLRRNRKKIFKELFTIGENGIRHRSAEASLNKEEEPLSSQMDSLMQLEVMLDEIEENVSN